MKSMHRADLYGWSRFDEERNVDFNALLWARPGGNVAVDPLPLSDHDLKHVEQLGGIAWIVITNRDHVRDAANLAARFGAQVAAPRDEGPELGLRVDRWIVDGDEVVPGLVVVALHGGKSPGEVALALEGRVLITGDLIRAHRGDSLHLLPAGRLADVDAVRASIEGLLVRFPGIDAVLVGDGWPIFRDGAERLRGLLAAEVPKAGPKVSGTAC